MNSQILQDLMDATTTFIEKSSHVDYQFTYEDQVALQRLIDTLTNQLNILVDYELKRGDSNGV